MSEISWKDVGIVIGNKIIPVKSVSYWKDESDFNFGDGLKPIQYTLNLKDEFSPKLIEIRKEIDKMMYSYYYGTLQGNPPKLFRFLQKMFNYS